MESELSRENRTAYLESIDGGIHVDSGLADLVRTLNTQLGVKTFYCCSGLWRDHCDYDALDFEFGYLSRNYPQYYTDCITGGEPIDNHVYRPYPDPYVTTEAFLHEENNGTVTVHPDFYEQFANLSLEPEIETHHDELRYRFGMRGSQSIWHVSNADSFAQCDERVQQFITALRDAIYERAHGHEDIHLDQ